MVKKSAALPEILKGTKRRMPHAVNYLHGSVHYNGMWLIFNNFDEAKYFFSDKFFRKEFKRIIKTEKEKSPLFSEKEIMIQSNTLISLDLSCPISLGLQM